MTRYIAKHIPLLIFVSSICSSDARRAEAQIPSASDLLPVLTEKLGGVRLLHDGAKAIGGGLAEGVREQAQQLIEQSVTPLIERVSAIVDQKIDKAYQDALDLLNRAEAALNRIIDHAHDASLDLIRKSLHELDQLISKTLGRVDATLRDALCKVAPYGQGLYIQNMPLSKRPDQVIVLDPGSSACWSTLPTADAQTHDLRREHLTQAVFVHQSYYVGMMCEREHDIARISPMDSNANERIQHLYEQLAAIATEAMCPTIKLEQQDLVLRELQYERKAVFYRDLAGGKSPLLLTW